MSESEPMNAPTSLAEIKSQGGAMAMLPDQAIDMFTERGFALANRVAKAFAMSNAVPAQFRLMNEKKVGNDTHWVENDAAMGNCIVAIEVARTVGTSIVSVMQSADIIEGKLRWSGKFQIAAINASGRFTPLRFQTIKRGKIKASYKEKTGWDKDARRPIFTERTVEVDDIECIAWALPKGYPEPRPTVEQMQTYRGRMLDLYRDLGLPVIESAPVTMALVVEEGWYGKPGSKWQTGLRDLMFQYRSGSFFGSIHAPDIVMGMGMSSEEARDVAQTFDLAADGTVTPTPINELRAPPPGPVPMADRVDHETGEAPPPPAAPAPAPKPAPTEAASAPAAAAPEPAPAAAAGDAGFGDVDPDPAAGQAQPEPQRPAARRTRTTPTAE